jgi:probable F420-dependent oxidoreductase
MTNGDHSVVMPERVSFYGTPRFYDPMVTFGFLAGSTKRLRFLTHVMVIPLRHPMVGAKQIATLDVVSKGRVIVGPGTGGMVAELESLGVPFDKRGGVTNDYLRAMKALWTQDVASYKGPYCHFEDVIALPKPVQKPYPPLWIGGNSHAAIRRAVNLGDGWIPWAIKKDQVKEALEYAVTLPNWPSVADRFEVVPGFHPLGGRAPRHIEQPSMKKPSDVSVDKVLEDIDSWRQAGATGLLTDFPGSSLQEILEALDWFATDVMPRVS